MMMMIFTSDVAVIVCGLHSHSETSVSVPSFFSADIRHALLPLTVTVLLQVDQPPTVRLDCEVGVRNVHSEHTATHLNSPP